MAKSIDYGSFRDLNDASKKVDADPSDKVTVQWWKAKPGDDLAAAVASQVQCLVQSDRPRIQQYNDHARLYGNQMSPLNNAGFAITTVSAPRSPVRDRIAFNLVQSCIDTLVSKMAKNKPKPYFLTSKGDSKIQRKAKKLNAFCAGVFYENDAYTKMPLGFRDGCVWGEGLINVAPYHGRVKWTRVLPYEVLTDYLESHSGFDQAMTLHWVKSIDRTTLMEMLPKEEKIIAGLQATNQMLANTTRSVADTVTIIESWRLPSAPDAEDGIHCITADGMTIMHEVYKKAFFPFATFRYNPRLHGFWGQGLAEQLSPIQTELNRCLMTVQRSFHLGGSFKILRHVTSKIIKSHLDNQIGTIIDWAGEHEPKYVIPPMVQPEIYQQIQTLKQMGYEQSGISQLSANGQKPAGLNSGEAQRVYHDIETDRFQMTGQAYEKFGLDLAMISISVGQDIYEEAGKLTMKVPGKRFIESVDWSDIDLEEDQYVLQCYPVSKLPTDPAGRLEHIQELMQAGLIEPEAGRRLLDYPDLEEEENLSNAQLDYLHQIFDALVEDGKYTDPDPAFHIPTQMKLAVEYYAVGRRDNLEPERLSMLRTYIKQLTAMGQAAAPQAQLGAGMPQANPAPPPVSNMIPNVPGSQPAA